MTFEEWLAFAAVWTAVSLPVGPNAVTCMTAAVANGTTRALWVPLGITFASLVHALIAAFGFGALLLASAEAFQLLKWIGVAYLLWLGVSLWRRPLESEDQPMRAPTEGWRLLRRGFLISMSNPKAVLVYLAIFTQAIAPSEPLPGQLLVLMPTASGICLLVYVGYVLLAAPLRRLLISAHRRRLFDRAAAGFYFTSAAVVALSDPRRAPA